MNSLDQRLLNALRADARTSVSELSRLLDVSRSTVQSRMARLRADGIIRGYTVVLAERYRRGRMRAHVLITTRQRLTARLNRQLEAIPEIIALHAISGEFDLIIEVAAESPEGLNHVLDQVGVLEGIERTQTSVILETRFSR